MKTANLKWLVPLLLMWLVPQVARAYEATLSDPGGGTIYAKTWVKSVTSSHSYGWWTGHSDEADMENLAKKNTRTDYGGVISETHPSVKLTFGYNNGTNKFDYKGTEYKVTVVTTSGETKQIAHNNKGESSLIIDDGSYAYACAPTSDGGVATLRVYPRYEGIREIRVEGTSYYHQDNFWISDGDITVGYYYSKQLSYKTQGMSKDLVTERVGATTVRLTSDMTGTPWPSYDQYATQNSGSGIEDCDNNVEFQAAYATYVYDLNGNRLSVSSWGHSRCYDGNRKSQDITVPADKEIVVKTVRTVYYMFDLVSAGQRLQSYHWYDYNSWSNSKTEFSRRLEGVGLNATATFNQVDGNVHLSWAKQPYGGEYSVYRHEVDAYNRTTTDRVLVGTTSAISLDDTDKSGFAYNKRFVYDVVYTGNGWDKPSIPLDKSDLPAGILSQTLAVNTTPQVKVHLTQALDVTDKIGLRWDFGNIPKSESNVTFNVNRIEPDGSLLPSIGSITVDRNASSAAYDDATATSACDVFRYFLTFDLIDGTTRCTSDTITARLLGNSLVTAVDATKGALSGSVRINWNVKQAGTDETLFSVERRFIGSSEWLQIHTTRGTASSYSYIDETAEPGRYYEYRVVAYSADCDGNGQVMNNYLTDAGYSQARGVVAGRVQFEGGTAVSDVRIDISRKADEDGARKQYYSRQVLDEGDAVTITGTGDVIEEGQPFTLQFYVRPERGTSTMTVLELPALVQLNYNSGDDSFTVTTNSVEAGTIPADEFTQISLVSDGTNVSTIIAGNNTAEQKDAASTVAQFPLVDDEIFYCAGDSFDGWTMDENAQQDWKINNNVFVTGYRRGMAYTDIAVPAEYVGNSATGSFKMRSPWGARVAEVIITMLDANNKTLGSTTFGRDLSQFNEWKEYSADFTIPSGTVKIRYEIEAQDNNNWLGNFGPQFKDMRIVGKKPGNSMSSLPLCNDFRGNVDDIRLWNRALTDDEIAADADRILNGREDGLKAYITFDEGLETYAFDESYTNGVANGKHPMLGVNTRPSTVVPTERQLSLYATTDVDGEYTLRGIPFTGSGTSYTVVPTKGVHSFSPTSRSGFISANSLSLNNYDFTDVSSFPVSGTIRYSGTDIPVDSVMFKIDGIPATRNNKTIYSDANGEYTIDVPIGEHYIEVERNGHTFEQGGRYPESDDALYNFVTETHLDFYDNTLVNVSGRVTGSEIEGIKPLGYGMSENTIGQATLTLMAIDHPQRRINAVRQVEGTTVQWVDGTEPVAVASATGVIASEGYRGYGDPDEVKRIYVTTDAKTGEFSAMIPPLRYRVESIKFKTNEDLNEKRPFDNISVIDLTNPLDSVRPDTLYINGTSEYLPLYRANAKLMLTYRSTPVIDVKQKGAPAGVFGMDTIVVDEKENIQLPVYSLDETGKVTYNYGYPMFQQHLSYTFDINLYEPYTNYDSGTPVTRNVALADSILTFNNALSDNAAVAIEDGTYEGYAVKAGEVVRLEANQARTDSLGHFTYTWNAGFPNLTSPYTRAMDITTKLAGRTYSWQPMPLEGIVLGVIPTGNNFITAGPSYVDMVLRDPPGGASTLKWTNDTTTTQYDYRINGYQNADNLKAAYTSGVEFITANGIGVSVINKMKVIHDEVGTWKYELSGDWDKRTYVTYSNSESVSTSSSNSLVGNTGDVFIGHSTNYIIGAANEVGLHKQSDGTYKLDKEEVISMGEQFETGFNFTQYYITGTLIPNIKATRNSMLTYVASESEIPSTVDKPMYFTTILPTDEKYGSNNDDENVWGADAKKGAAGPSYWAKFPVNYQGCDSVMWCNESVRLWEAQLAANEKDKLDAFNNESKYKKKNISFDWGSGVSESISSNTVNRNNYTFNFKTNLGWSTKGGATVNGVGGYFENEITAGYHYTEGSVDERTKKETFAYNLVTNSKNTALTVDIFDSPAGWSPIFRTRAGQTRCPYEGERVTKYYQKGSVLDYATMKVDNPHITMPVTTLTNIPAGGDGLLTMILTNESETHEEYNIVELILDNNPNGLQVLMDGQPLIAGNEQWIPYGQSYKKTLTVRQSNPAILDYENVKILLHSTCQTYNYYDSVQFSVHFVPAAPELTLQLDKTVLNRRAVQSGDEIAVTIKDIDRNFTGFETVRLKYRFAGDDSWVTANEWKVAELPSDEANIHYTLKLPDFDGTYMVMAESAARFGNDEVLYNTPEQAVIRDTRGPKLLGQAYPNTGFLLPTDDITIKFNEDIRESYLTKDGNFFITGSLNDSQVTHDVSLQFNGSPVETDAYLPINNTSIAASMWLKRKTGGTLIEHGTEGNSLTVAINDLGQVEVNINGNIVNSQDVVPENKWVYLALNYVKGATAGNNTLSMIMAEDDKSTLLFDEEIVPDYNANGQLTLGRDFTGMMHELVLWNKNYPVRAQLGQKDEAVAAYLPGLVGYWKMNEGHGNVVTDYARGRNIHLPAETWNIENSNIAAHLDGSHSIRIPIAAISPRETDSYVVETWFRGEPDKNAGATLLSVTDKISIDFDYDNSLVLQTYSSTDSSLDGNGNPIILSNNNYSDGNWHHFAMNVHRGVSAVVYLDGKAVKTIAEQEVPAPDGDYLYVGSILKNVNGTSEEQNFFTGDIDEIRIWNAAVDGTSIIANRYNEVDTTDMAGLIAYYPMEHSRLDAAGNIITEFSLDNKAPADVQYDVTEALGEGVTQAATAPALRTAPLKQNLDFDFTASSNEIYINLKTLPARMQGNLLTFMVKDVRDMRDNLSEPIMWSAVVDYNTLMWISSGITVDKDRLTSETASAYLLNIGRESEHYSISGLPTWINVDSPEGVLAVGESQSIMFTIGTEAPVGRHLIYAYAINDDDISSPLLLDVNIRGNEPSWTVNPDDYESSMNIIGQIYLDDKICGNTDTKIAAFVGNECRGVASPKLVTTRDAYFVSMNVYGVQDVTGDQRITFRIYDADNGVILGDVKTLYKGNTLNLTYSPNGIMGDFDYPVEWRPSSTVEQLCNLQTGWNWISLYVEPEQTDLESVFGHAKVFNTIKGKEGFAMNSGSQWTSTGLENVEPGHLYKLKMKADAEYSISGNRINTQETTQTIYSGWNWIGPLSIYNLSLNEAFADLGPTRGDIVKSKNQVAFYDGYKWEGDLTALIPGMGYYYKSNNVDSVTFRYPTVDANYYAAPALKSRRAYSPFTPVDHHRFSDNMNVVARVTVNGVEVDTLTVGAFIGNECRGVATATDDGYYMLTIAGNAEETGAGVSFKTVIDGNVVGINEKLTWGSDMLYGDLDEPVKFTVASSGVDDIYATDGITITPTLVRDVVNVRSGSELASVTVYAVSGAVVVRETDLGDTTTSLRLGYLPSGVYLVEVTTVTGNHLIKRIVKQ